MRNLRLTNLALDHIQTCEANSRTEIIAALEWLHERTERTTEAHLFASLRGDSDNNVFLKIVTFRVWQRQILDLKLELHPLKTQQTITVVTWERRFQKYAIWFAKTTIFSKSMQTSWTPVNVNLAKFLAHLVGLRHHGHQFDVVVEDGEQTGVCLRRSSTGLTWSQTDGKHPAAVPPKIKFLLLDLLILSLTQVDALSSSQFRLEVIVIVIVTAPVIPAPLRWIANEQVGTVWT